MKVKPSSSTVDLLTLIGQAIGQLQQSIECFEEQDRAAGLECLSKVIEDIDHYLERLGDDPLVSLTHVDPAKLKNSLLHVQGDLAVVIDRIRTPPSSDA